MKIKVWSKDKCLTIAKVLNHKVNQSDDVLLDYLPDEVFGKSFEVTSQENNSYSITDAEGYTWSVRTAFIEKIDDGKKYHKVTITERLQREVWVQADSPEEASEIVQRKYQEQKHVLTADDYAGTTFTVETGTVE